MHCAARRLWVSGLSVLFFLSPAAASEIRHLKKSETFCDDSGAVCLRGTLSYHPNARLLELRARVVKAPGAGQVSIRLSGNNRQQHQRRTAIEISISGRRSQIVNKNMIPDPPDVSNWEVTAIVYRPE